MIDDRLPTGSAKADWLAGFVTTAWHDLDRPCSEAAVEVAVAFAADCAGRLRRGGSNVLIHGDPHTHNLLVHPAATGMSLTFNLIDPEGLASEPAHDLGVALRGWNDDLVAGKTAEVALQRCQTASRLTGVSRLAIWQWSFIERLSTGLFLLKLGHRHEARAFLEVADRLAGVCPSG